MCWSPRVVDCSVIDIAARLKNNMPQGLGTGSLFTNNFDSPLTVKNGTLQYDLNTNWNFNLLQ